MYNLKIAASVAVAMLTAGSALAAEPEGKLYITMHGGWAFFGDVDGDASDPTFVIGDTETDDDFTLGGAIGYKFNQNIRAEVELSWLSTEADATATDTTIPPPNSALLKADVEVWSGMINGFYDIDTGSPWVPSVGGGIGIANVSIDNVTLGGVSCAALGGGSACDDDTTDFAWQLGGGLRYRLASGFTIGTDYRYFRVETEDDALDAHKVLIIVGTDF